MKEQADKIQIAINTIQKIEIKASIYNMDRLLAALQLLSNVRDELNATENGQEINFEVEGEETEDSED